MPLIALVLAGCDGALSTCVTTDSTAGEILTVDADGAELGLDSLGWMDANGAGILEDASCVTSLGDGTCADWQIDDVDDDTLTFYAELDGASTTTDASFTLSDDCPAVADVLTVAFDL